MALRTISIFQGHCIALQGHWIWDGLLDFSFVYILTRSRRPDHSILDPTIFTSPPRPHDVPTSTLTFSDYRMPGTYEGEVVCVHVEDQGFADTGTGATTTFDDTEDDQEFSFLDSSLSSTDFDPPLRVESYHAICGLGISGLWSKDGSEPFTGLGVISIRPFPWRYIPTPGNLGSNYGQIYIEKNASDFASRHNLPHEVSDENGNTSSIQAQILEDIVERYPRSSAASRVATEITPTQQPVAPINHSDSEYPRRIPSLPRPTKHFATPTISSELKKISHACSNVTSMNSTYRRRSSRNKAVPRGANSSCFHEPHTPAGVVSPTLRRSLGTSAATS